MLYQPLNGFSFSMGVRIEPNSIVEYSTFLHTEVYFYQIFLNHQNSEVNGRRGLEPIHNKAKQWQWNRRNPSDSELKPVLLTLYLWYWSTATSALLPSMILPNITKVFLRYVEEPNHVKPKFVLQEYIVSLLKEKEYPRCVKKHPKYLDPYHPPWRLLPPTNKQQWDWVPGWVSLP